MCAEGGGGGGEVWIVLLCGEEGEGACVPGCVGVILCF